MVVAIEQDLVIKRIAINALDLDYSEPLISENLFPMTNENEKFNTFFQTHFNDTRSGKSTKSCKFIDPDATIKTKIQRYYENKNDVEFLKLSKELTENLFKIMQKSTNSSGTFFVMEVELNNEELIFLIKLDPKNAIQFNSKTLTLSYLENILPDTNDRVHKCAIIKNPKTDLSETELFVLDRQQREGEPAKYFLETYLQAEELLNDRMITKEVMSAARDKILRIFPEVGSNLITESLDREFTNGSRVNLEDSIKNIFEDIVPLQQEDRELYINNSAKEFVSDYLQKNPDHQTTFKVERKDNLVIYKADKGQIYFRFNKGLMSSVSVKGDELGNTIIKIDKSLNFRKELK